MSTLEIVMKRLNWEFDMLIYRLFYWRWSPRLQGDPNLVYLFSRIGDVWTSNHPPSNPDQVDAFLREKGLNLSEG